MPGKHYRMGGKLKDRVKEKLNTALAQRSRVRAAGVEAKMKQAASELPGKKKAAEDKAVAKATDSLKKRANKRLDRRKAKSRKLVEKGRMAKAARVSTRADIKYDRDAKRVGSKTAAATKKAGAKAVKRAERKNERMANRADRRYSRAADRGMYKRGGKIVAQGADKKDVRREKKQDRKARRSAPKETTTTKTMGNRTVIKQRNKSGKVKSTRKTVYSGNQASRLVTKEKQRPNRAGKKAGMLSIKDKVVDRRDFSVRRKTKGIDPRGGS